MLYNFKAIGVVPGSSDFIDIVLSKTQRGTPTVVHKGANFPSLAVQWRAAARASCVRGALMPSTAIVSMCMHRMGNYANTSVLHTEGVPTDCFLIAK